MPEFAPIKLSSPATREFWEIPVLFEDEHLLAVDLPPDLRCSPDADHPELPSLMQLLHEGIEQNKPWATSRKLTNLDYLNRVDPGTGGVLLLAKTEAAFTKLADQFGADRVDRLSAAIVEGAPLEDRFSITLALAPDPRRPGTMGVAPRSGKRSRTDVEVVTRFRGYALLHCREITSRLHQVRVHLQRSRLPIAGDQLYYGNPLLLSNLKPHYNLKPGAEERPLIPHIALHLHQLTVTHPVSGERLTITSPLPKDFGVALKYLNKYAGF